MSGGGGGVGRGVTTLDTTRRARFQEAFSWGKFTADVVGTSSKFATGVIVTGRKYAAGVVTLVANLLPESLIAVVIFIK
jgi:hypothetical protein